jgi:hypothetical protein
MTKTDAVTEKNIFDLEAFAAQAQVTLSKVLDIKNPELRYHLYAGAVNLVPPIAPPGSSAVVPFYQVSISLDHQRTSFGGAAHALTAMLSVFPKPPNPQEYSIEFGLFKPDDKRKAIGKFPYNRKFDFVDYPLSGAVPSALEEVIARNIDRAIASGVLKPAFLRPSV